jgi:D-glycero-D-manno-heptose 1,7-bisphosphate phosphatase
MFPAIFLDRDGVIIENRSDYVRSWEDVAFIPGALSALAKASMSTYKIIIVTNQSAIGRGIISYQTAEEINQRLIQMISNAGGRVDGVFMCPHAPEEKCSCRKPQPGLILQAAEALDLDLSRSTLIGDALSDIQAGQAAGVCQRILVRTGRGSRQKHLPQPQGLDPYCVCDSLIEALGDCV